MLKENFKILVTAVGTATSIGIIKRIRKERPQWVVIGTDINKYGYTAGSLLVDKYYSVPYATEKNHLSEIKRIIEDNNVDYLWPINDSEIRIISRKGKNLCDHIMANPEVITLVFDKYVTARKMRDIGVMIPRSIEPSDGFVGKCIIRKKEGVGSTGIRIVDRWGNETVDKDEFVQEFVDGTEYTVDVLCDRQGIPMYVIPRKRLEVKAGVSTKAEIIEDKEIISTVERILNELVLPGFSNIQFIRSCDGKLFFIEINPRIGGFSSASLLAAPEMFPTFVRLIENNDSQCRELNKGVAWGMIVTRYYEEIVYKV